MKLILLTIVFALHVYTIYDAVQGIQKRNGAFRVVLAFFPPIIGPLWYFITKSEQNSPSKSSFLNQKKISFRK